MKGIFLGRQIKELKGRSQKMTRSQTALQAYNAIMQKYGEVSDTAKYFHKGNGIWQKYSITNDSRRTGKIAPSRAEWEEQPQRLDWWGEDTKGDKPKRKFSVSQIKGRSQLSTRKSKAALKMTKEPVTKKIKRQVKKSIAIGQRVDDLQAHRLDLLLNMEYVAPTNDPLHKYEKYEWELSHTFPTKQEYRQWKEKNLGVIKQKGLLQKFKNVNTVGVLQRKGKVTVVQPVIQPAPQAAPKTLQEINVRLEAITKILKPAYNSNRKLTAEEEVLNKEANALIRKRDAILERKSTAAKKEEEKRLKPLLQSATGAAIEERKRKAGKKKVKSETKRFSISQLKATSNLAKRNNKKALKFSKKSVVKMLTGQRYRYASFMRPLGNWFNPGVSFKFEDVKSSDRDFRYNRAPHSVISTGTKLSKKILQKFELTDLDEGKKMQELIQYVNKFDFLNSSMKNSLERLILEGASKGDIDKYIEKGRKQAEKKLKSTSGTIKPERKFSVNQLKQGGIAGRKHKSGIKFTKAPVTKAIEVKPKKTIYKGFLVTGNTYPLKYQIKTMGGKWNKDEGGWIVPATATAAKQLNSLRKTAKGLRIEALRTEENVFRRLTEADRLDIRREKADRKIERLQNKAVNQMHEYTARDKAAHNAVEGIPLGQPIIVGGAGERAHRNALAAAMTNTSKAVNAYREAEKAYEKAESLAEFTNCIESPTALKGRVVKLERELKTLENRLKKDPAHASYYRQQIENKKADIVSIRARIPASAVTVATGVTMKDLTKLKKPLGLVTALKRYHNKNLQGGNFAIDLRWSDKTGEGLQLSGYHDPDSVVYSLSIGALYGGRGQPIITKENYREMTLDKVISSVKKVLDAVRK